MIICAAIRLTMNNQAQTQHIVCGLRHGDCLKTIAQLNDNWRCAKQEEGFIDHCGNFLNRGFALVHAERCGQINKHNAWFREDNAVPDELFSEDLY